MTNEQLLSDLKSLLDYLNQQLNEIKSSQDKFLVALTGVLKVTSADNTALLTKLHGDSESLSAYLIQTAIHLSDSVAQSYETACKRIESIIKVLSSDRKS
jgi:hypothetical protein